MTTVEARSDRRPSPLEWTVRAAWLLALIGAALQLIGVLIAIGSIPGILGGNPITASIDTMQRLHGVGQNFYGGTAFIADGSAVTATRVTAQVQDAATSVRIGLAFGPLAWALTGAGVAYSLALAFGRFAAVRPSAHRASRALVAAAAVVAVCTSAAQVLDDIARTGLQGVMWHGPSGMERLGSGVDATFQLGWIAVAVGLLATAAIASRATDDRGGEVLDPLQHER